MENWQNPLFIVLVLTGLTFIIMAIIVSKYPPKKINKVYGYRTKRSMKSQDRWDFAQKMSNDLMYKYGILFSLFGIGGYFISMEPVTSSLLAVAIIVAMSFYLVFQTEQALKAKFGDN